MRGAKLEWERREQAKCLRRKSTLIYTDFGRKLGTRMLPWISDDVLAPGYILNVENPANMVFQTFAPENLDRKYEPQGGQPEALKDKVRKSLVLMVKLVGRYGNVLTTISISVFGPEQLLL
jgi:hypothetical protein